MRTAQKILVAALAAGLLAGCAPTPQERMDRAEKAMSAHRYSHARPDFQAILQDEPDNVRAQAALVRVFMAQDDPASALAMLDALAKRSAEPRNAALLRGEINLMLGRFDQALDAVANDPSAEAWRIRAIVYTGRNEPEQVQAAFENGLRATGPRARFLADYARFRLEKGEVAAARDLARPLE